MQTLSHLQLAHSLWRSHLHRGDWAIDATCGAGWDTRVLAEILQEGGVIALDLQEEALSRTRERLGADLLQRVHLFQQSHAHFPLLAQEKPIRLIVYNLGYLPRGDKAITTLAHSTLTSLESATQLLAPGGLLSITCYPGHPEGAREKEQLLTWAASLPPARWRVFHYTSLNQLLAPSLLLVYRQSPAMKHPSEYTHEKQEK